MFFLAREYMQIHTFLMEYVISNYGYCTPLNQTRFSKVLNNNEINKDNIQFTFNILFSSTYNIFFELGWQFECELHVTYTIYEKKNLQELF